MLIGEYIQDKRVELGYSLSEFARLCNISKGYMYQLEAGNSDPSLKTLSKIADAFGMPLHEMIKASGLERELVSLKVEVDIDKHEIEWLDENHRGEYEPMPDCVRRVLKTLLRGYMGSND